MGYLIGGIDQAMTGVALFALAGFRVAPSIIRFQSVLSTMIALSEFPRQILAELKAAELSGGAIAARPTGCLRRSCCNSLQPMIQH